LVVDLAVTTADGDLFSGDPELGFAEFFYPGQGYDERPVYPYKIPGWQFFLDAFEGHEC